MQELAPTSPRVGPVLQYLRDRPTPLGELYGEIKSKMNVMHLFAHENTWMMEALEHNSNIGPSHGQVRLWTGTVVHL